MTNKQISKQEWINGFNDYTKVAFETEAGIRLTSTEAFGMTFYYLAGDGYYFRLDADTSFDLLAYYHEAYANNMYEHFNDKVSGIVLGIIGNQHAPAPATLVGLEGLF
ncbi:hypothetical protein [Sporosarcina beigongshangi]|uniref:hypothetical protein n=1 Tax=Sporosarcina beigongshangi TaxID=2782538 RepID=UPI00193A66A8|nr:hypothetical protein [Sporosarcina beigongshangi]